MMITAGGCQGSAGYRKIALRTKTKDLKVQARDGYYADRWRGSSGYAKGRLHPTGTCAYTFVTCCRNCNPRRWLDLGLFLHFSLPQERTVHDRSITQENNK